MFIVQVINHKAQLINDIANAGYYTLHRAALVVDYYVRKGIPLADIRTQYNV